MVVGAGRLILGKVEEKVIYREKLNKWSHSAHSVNNVQEEKVS